MSEQFTPTPYQVEQLAKGITITALQNFFADPQTEKAFQEWKKKQEER